MAFTPIENQEDLDRIIGERLTREREKMEKKYAGYLSPDDLFSKTSELNEKIAELTASITDYDAKTKEFERVITEKEATIKNYETASVKRRIALELGLPATAETYLQGDTEETIRKSAEGLKSIIPNTTPPAYRHDPEPGNERNEALKGVLKNLRGE